jgi:repressor LexA
MSEPLSPLERKVYLYLIDYLGEHTFQPSVRDIAKEFGIRSTKTVAAVLKALQGKGYIERESSRSRGVKLIGLTAPTHMLPVPRYLRLSGERPALRDENLDGHVTFDRRYIPNPDVFVLVADEKSVAGAAGVMPGDLTIVDPLSPATDGALVLARVGHDTVIRSIEHRGSQTVLISAHNDEPEIALGPSSDFEIVGVVCGLLRGKEH